MSIFLLLLLLLQLVLTLQNRYNYPIKSTRTIIECSDSRRSRHSFTKRLGRIRITTEKFINYFSLYAVNYCEVYINFITLIIMKLWKLKLINFTTQHARRYVLVTRSCDRFFISNPTDDIAFHQFGDDCINYAPSAEKLKI